MPASFGLKNIFAQDPTPTLMIEKYGQSPDFSFQDLSNACLVGQSLHNNSDTELQALFILSPHASQTSLLDCGAPQMPVREVAACS